MKKANKIVVHPDIIAETPGVELESDYNKVIDQDLQEETLSPATHADCAAITRSKINLNQEHNTGKVKGVETIVIEESESESDDDADNNSVSS